jgi:hypothetical protein
MLNEVVAAIAGDKGLLKEVYGDLAKPGVTQVGLALETILGLGNTIMLPIQLLNAKGKYTIESNLNKYREKLQNKEESEVVGVVPEVGVPIVEKLAYVTNEQLVELYTELLAKASTKSHNKFAHPNFVNIIGSLSPDEALLIRTLKGKESLPFIDRTLKKTSGGYQVIEPLITGLDSTDGIAFPTNTKAYLSNLEALGILKIRRDVWVTDNLVYEQLSQRHELNIAESKEYKPDMKKGVIEITNLGKMFIQGCVEEKA